MNKEPQIFQTNSPFRWNSVKWTTRVLIVIGIILLTVVIVAIVQGTSPSLTNIETKNRFFKDVVNPLQQLNIPYAKYKNKGFKSFLEMKDREDSLNKLKGKKIIQQTEFIRAAFYDPAWNHAASLSDLEANAGKLNTIFPQWLFINLADNSKIESRIDSAGLAIMKKNKLKI
jgi:hypothetical protein